MIKEALEYIVGLNKPQLTEVKGETYTDKTLVRVNHNPKAEHIEMRTLTSLMDYIRSDTDVMSNKMILHVKSHNYVKLYSSLDTDREREIIADVIAELPEFSFGRFIPHEEFCIAMQSKFIENDDRNLLLRFAGTVEAGTVAQYGDDGVSQKATIKTGIASKADAVIPGTVTLKPYRTFLNLEQPESQFLFRMREGAGGIECAIFEADGGAWKDEARRIIYNYLMDELRQIEEARKPGMPKRSQFIVIS